MPYPTLPGHRFMYESDGTVVLFAQNVVPTSSSAQTDTVKALLNDMGGDAGMSFTMTGSSGQHWITFVFPEARDILGLNVFDTGANHQAQIYTSVDTTNGIDGTWNLQTTYSRGRGAVMDPQARSGWQVAEFLGIKGIRFGGTIIGGSSANVTVYSLHLYGNKSVDQGLAFWDETLDSKCDVSQFDFQDVPQGSTHTKQFRVKNRHATQQANSITISALDHEAFLGLTFSTSVSGPFVTSLDIGNLAAGAVSSMLYCRRVADPALAVGVHQARVQAVAGSWT